MKKETKKIGATFCLFRRNSYHVETSQLIWAANQFTGFYMMWVFTESIFEQTTILQLIKVFFFQQNLILRLTKVFFCGNLIWRIISFIWRISGKTAKFDNISSRENIFPKAVIVICSQVCNVIKNVEIALCIHCTWQIPGSTKIYACEILWL